MKTTLIICQLLIIISIITNITITFLFKKNNNNLKFLTVVPKLSLLQIIISELITLKINVSNRTIDNTYVNLNLATYAIAESTFIILFLLENYKLKKEKMMILFLSSVSVTIFFIENIFIDQNVFLSTKYFHIVFGFILEIVLLVLFINSIKGKSIDEVLNDNRNIPILGIFISYILIWPTNIIQEFIFKNPKQYYEYFFIANSLGYFVFYTFLSIAFYVSRKH